MPRGIYERKPYMKNCKTEQTARIEHMLGIKMTRKEICRALRITEGVVAMVIHRRNQKIKDATPFLLGDTREI